MKTKYLAIFALCSILLISCTLTDPINRIEYVEVNIEDPDAFVSVWMTDNVSGNGIKNNTIELPLVENGSYDFLVDWGDGSSDRITSYSDDSKLHTYRYPGTYTVIVNGRIEGFSFDYSYMERSKIVNIRQWGTLAFGQTERQFRDCRNLEITASDSPDLSKTTSLVSAFDWCESLEQITGLSSWDTSTITDMSFMFAGAELFNQDLSGLNTSNVTNMQGMFYAARSFNQSLSIWNTSNVINMSMMFESASSFNGDISNWDTSNVTDMGRMFADARSFNQNISGWNTASVTDMSMMFCGAAVFNQDISGWYTTNVTDMSVMFYLADQFNQDISSWLTTNVTDMEGMFCDAASFNQDISGWDVSSVSNMAYMFSDAEVFDQDLSAWNIENVKYLHEIFRGVTLSTSNYDAILNSWGYQNVYKDIQFNGGYSKYSSAAAAARQRLIDEEKWIIEDGGLE